MKKFNKYIFRGILFSAIIGSLSVSSCKKFLSVDDYFSDELKLDTVFSQTRHVKAYLWGTTDLLPDEGAMYKGGSPGVFATDEGFTSFLTSSNYPGMSFVLGEITAANLLTLNRWGNYYRVIRKCNTIFNRIDEAKDMETADRFEILGNARFIRAYAYYNILVDFGPPILLGDEIIESNAALEDYDRPRSTYDEAVEYICNELEEASKFLPSSVSLVEFGLPTKGAAYGLIARIRLLHASPLYNGGDAARSYFGTWKRSTDNVNYVSQTYDEKRWAVAAAAAKRIIDLGETGMYKLHTVPADSETPALPTGVTTDPDYYNLWPNGAAGIDPFRSYSEMFNGESVLPVNPEYVWGRRSSALVSETQASFPQKLDGWNGASVTQKVIDNYTMIDGRDIANSSPDYPYTETGFTGSAKIFSGYRLNANVSNMYNNREARFYASIGFSGAFWPMTSSTSSGYYNQTIEYYFDSPNGKGSVSSPVDFPITGYVIKKYIHPSDAFGGTNARRMDKAFPIVRYAEILISYAEALNNLTGTHSVELDGNTHTFSRDMVQIRKAFNPIRYRAGIPGLSGSEDKETVQRLIEKERMIEFLFENRRYYDVRRWGIMETVESEPIRGMNIEGSRDVFFNRVIPNSSRIGARIVNKRLALLPIPLNEVRLLPSLDQNPGWDN
ncbi:RagB/SusD family nutrient uptake outer membrane protein [Sphingobacterium sp. HJSM2_6]|uniref:RagB/SusD family nutrient uptake outer membrane protein n=1 Tax=Sphingobacterium sp. HJSM2_6 TaxID=3366264 RepID=UPI003BED850A